MKQGLFYPYRAHESVNYDALPIYTFLREHRVIFMMILTLVAGSRLTQNDPSHQDGTRRDEEFEDAVAAVMKSLARHSAKVNGWWCKSKRGSVDGLGAGGVEETGGVSER
jgi:hypothetical protein